MQFDEDVDAISLLCPLPVLKARKRLQSLRPGQVLRLQADDPAARLDVPHFCAQDGHELLSVETHGAVRHFYLRKGNPANA